MSIVLTTDTFRASLLRHIEGEMQALVESEAEAAAERVRAKAREMAPRLVMALMANFDVTRDQNQFIIKVRTEEPKA